MSAFDVLEHTADIGIRAYGATREELFQNAALGVQSLALDMHDVQPASQYCLHVTGEDLESLLVNWLNEIIFYLDARHIVMSRFEFEAFSDTEVSAQAWGEQRDPQRHPPQLVIKAATYHQLSVRLDNQGFTAEVYLDI